MALLIKRIPAHDYIRQAKIERPEFRCGHQQVRTAYVETCKCTRHVYYCDVYLRLLSKCNCSEACEHALPQASVFNTEELPLEGKGALLRRERP